MNENCTGGARHTFVPTPFDAENGFWTFCTSCGAELMIPNDGRPIITKAITTEVRTDD